MNNITKLKDLIATKKVSDTTFIGQNKDIGSPIVFGGQVLAQGMYAMSQTVSPERIAHSLHSYFILPGDLEVPITYDVEIIRDGGSFSTRRVMARQNGKVIFFMGASFQGKEDGYEHQISMPQVPAPDTLHSWDDIYHNAKDNLPKGTRQFLSIKRPIIFKPVQLDNLYKPTPQKPNYQVWFKVKGETENNAILNRSILAYISDYNLLSTALRPHADKTHRGKLQMATIDHAMWFFKEADINQWFLYSIDSPTTYGARGFCRGHIFAQNGDLVASVTQEGLLRPKK